MTHEHMAHFICELRKSRNLTQKQLAAQLNLTDKAISKWERGLGYPDITTLSKLAEALGVTTNELLNGCREEHPAPAETAIIQSIAQYSEKVSRSNNRGMRKNFCFILSLACALAMFVCVVCNLAISGALTWSLYPLASVAFGWLVSMPLFYFDKNRIALSLLSLSVFTVPFLYSIEQIDDGGAWLLALGVPIAAASLVYLWAVWGILLRTKLNRWVAAGSCALLAVPLHLLINAIVSRFTNDPFWNVWDVLSAGFLFFLAIVLFAVGVLRKKQ